MSTGTEPFGHYRVVTTLDLRGGESLPKVHMWDGAGPSEHYHMPRKESPRLLGVIGYFYYEHGIVLSCYGILQL